MAAVNFVILGCQSLVGLADLHNFTAQKDVVAWGQSPISHFRMKKQTKVNYNIILKGINRRFQISFKIITN